MRFSPLVFALLFAFSAEAGRIHGKVSAEGGTPLPDAVVEVVPLTGEVPTVIADHPTDPGVRHPVAADGTIEFELTGPGPFAVWFRAPGRRSTVLPLLAAPASPLTVDAELAGAPRIATLEPPAACWRSSGRFICVPLVKREDGSYFLRADSSDPEVHYQLRVLGDRHPHFFPNPSEPRVTLGKYWFESIATPRDGHFEIVFRPGDLPSAAPNARSKVTLPQAPELQAVFQAVDGYRAMNVLPPGEERTAAAKVLARELFKTTRDARAALEARQIAAVLAVHLHDVTTTDERAELGKLLPPDAKAWSLYPLGERCALSALVGSDQATVALLNSQSQHHPDRRVRAFALCALMKMAERDGRTRDTTAFKERLESEFHDLDEVLELAFPKPPEFPLAGKPFPALNLRALSGRTLDEAWFRGHYTLVDFSSIGCGACDVLEPELVELRKAIPAKRLRMVTVTLGLDDAELKKRLRRHPLSWEQVALRDDQDDLLKSWDIRYFPTLYLIDPNGRVMAVDPELRSSQVKLIEVVQSRLRASGR